MKLSTKTNGFTLIEILVALVILSIALLALAGLMTTTTRNNAGGGHLTEAATSAQDVLERVRLSPLDSIPSNVMAQDTYVGSTGMVYTRNWIATRDASNLFDTITITVTWSNPVNHSITMVSVVPQQ